MMSAMIMLSQGGIDAAVEKYGFRLIGLFTEYLYIVVDVVCLLKKSTLFTGADEERKSGAEHPDTADVLYSYGSAISTTATLNM